MLSTNLTKMNRYWLSDLIYMAILLGCFYAIWIGSYALFTPDEGRYSEVAREMVASGDYITPRLNGVAFLDKPVLYYWLQASAIHLFGLKEWALRFWPAFMGILGCLMTYLAGSLLFNRRTGLIAALILATAPLYYGAAHYANLDLEVAVLISNSLLFFIMATQLPECRLRKVFMVSAYLFASLAFLTKGLIGVAFPMMIIGAWILILNRWDLLKKMHLVIGLVLFVCITTPWYVLAQKANPEFLHFFFVTQQVTRFLTKAEFNNKTAFWFYFPIVFAGLFPWALFYVQAVTHHIKKIWQNRQENAVNLFLVLWLFIIFTFFSIPKSKTVGYIIPIFPALALLVANYLDCYWEKAKAIGVKAGTFTFIILSIISSTVLIAAPHIKAFDVTPDMTSYLYIAAALFMIGAIVCIYLLRTNLFSKVFYCLLTVACVFLLTMTASSSSLNKRSIKPLTKELNNLIQAGDEVVTYYKFYYDLPIYTGKRITIVADWDAPDIASNDNWVRELWYGMPFQNTQTWLIKEDTLLKRWNGDKRLFILTDTGYYDQLKAAVKGNVYMIARYKNTLLLSNKEIEPG